MTPLQYAMKRMEEEAKNGGFENTAADPYGIVDMFKQLYLGKNRPIGWLPDKNSKDRAVRNLYTTMKVTQDAHNEMYDADIKTLDATGYQKVLIGGATEQNLLREVPPIYPTTQGWKQQSVLYEGQTQYAIRIFAEQVDEIKNGTFDSSNQAYMGTTSPRLSNILGLPKLPMLVTPNHIVSMALTKSQAIAQGKTVKGVHYHGLGWEAVKSLPVDINRPALIIKSNTNPDDARFVVITNRIDSNGDPIICAIKPNGTGNYFDIYFNENAFLSGYGKKIYSILLLQQKMRTESFM